LNNGQQRSTLDFQYWQFAGHDAILLGAVSPTFSCAPREIQQYVATDFSVNIITISYYSVSQMAILFLDPRQGQAGCKFICHTRRLECYGVPAPGEGFTVFLQRPSPKDLPGLEGFPHGWSRTRSILDRPAWRADLDQDQGYFDDFAK
jgi:hypothetical protein